ncbi:microneme protein MIC13 [Besnoitia besnoiti]|uniref:Microneme protein MIC13 n=1 Tax=Besnoitia besnoiti TaxID=94643 RepID=A0A2A9MNY4_BESBE|nr:microneme protein MIC13 [Besnoitia besnoiti]PFH37996.1 microneme protein MIC13 [Besnoitia besnoiti]
MQCANEFGNYFSCLGAINPNKTFHSTANSELLNLIKSDVERSCSPIQASADKFCDGARRGSVARKALFSPRSSGAAIASLMYEARSICKDNCGGERQCPGGRSETKGEAIKQHLTKEAELKKVFDSQAKPCPNICVPTSMNPPVTRCVVALRASVLTSAQEQSHAAAGEAELMGRCPWR